MPSVRFVADVPLVQQTLCILGCSAGLQVFGIWAPPLQKRGLLIPPGDPLMHHVAHADFCAGSFRSTKPVHLKLPCWVAEDPLMHHIDHESVRGRMLDLQTTRLQNLL